MDPHNLICVYNSNNPAKAEMVRNLLEADGIRAVTADTHNPFPGLSIMPSEVFVEQLNKAQALEVIADAERNHGNASDDDDAEE